MTISPKNSGWIEVICGPMFSGKTEELIRRLVRAQFAKQEVAIFKPKTDNRYSDDYIVSHNQRKIKSLQVHETNNILDYKDKADVFGIDEAQFFDKSIVISSFFNDASANNLTKAPSIDLISSLIDAAINSITS